MALSFNSLSSSVSNFSPPMTFDMGGSELINLPEWSHETIPPETEAQILYGTQNSFGKVDSNRQNPILTERDINASSNKKRKIHLIDEPKEGAKKIQKVKQRFACDYPGCTKSYKRNYTLNRHKKSHIAWENAKIICQRCKKFFPDHSTFKRHERSHTGFKPYPCPYTEACGKRFSEKNNLKKHIKTKHDGIWPPYAPEVTEDVDTLLALTTVTNISSAQTNRNTKDTSTIPPSHSESSASSSTSFSSIQTPSSPLSVLHTVATDTEGVSSHLPARSARRKKTAVKKVYVCPVENCWHESRLLNQLKIHFRNKHPKFSLNS
jgi:C2H2-type zinc finger/Zinc finger, C2H2 type